MSALMQCSMGGIALQALSAQCFGVFSGSLLRCPDHGGALEVGEINRPLMPFVAVSDAHLAAIQALLNFVDLNANIKFAAVLMWSLLELVILKHLGPLGEVVMSAQETYHKSTKKDFAPGQNTFQPPTATIGTCKTKAGAL